MFFIKVAGIVKFSTIGLFPKLSPLDFLLTDKCYFEYCSRSDSENFTKCFIGLDEIAEAAFVKSMRSRKP
jgi:hypothetical protein